MDNRCLFAGRRFDIENVLLCVKEFKIKRQFFSHAKICILTSVDKYKYHSTNLKFSRSFLLTGRAVWLARNFLLSYYSFDAFLTWLFFLLATFTSFTLQMILSLYSPKLCISIRHLHISHNTRCLLPKILHNLCVSFLLGIIAVPRGPKRNWKQC